MKKTLIIHPFLMAIFPILSLFAYNIEQTLFSETLIPFTIALSFTTLAILSLSLILKDKLKTGIIISIFLFLFFSYGHVYDLIQARQIEGFRYGRHTYLMIIWCFLLLCGIYFTVRARRDLHNLNYFLNITASSLVVLSLIHICVYELKGKGRLSGTENITTDAEIARSKDANALPDIYYIIFDRYASASTLKNYYNFDNGGFIDCLSKKGFYVASHSKANYQTTVQSLASSLNMEYLTSIIEKMGEESTDFIPFYEMVQDYKVWRFLKLKGYKFVHFGGWAAYTFRNRYADMNYNSIALPEFSMILYQSTMFFPITSKFGLFASRKEQWMAIQYIFNKLSDMPKIEEPTFAFAYFISPHDPYLFGENGEFLSERLFDADRKRKAYVSQIIFLNKKIEDLVNKLLHDSEIKPIIILQADEGPLCRRYQFDEESFDWQQATKDELREKFGILNAYYLPEVDKNVLYPSITPVNSFRMIFNLYFGTDFKLLHDKSFINKDYRYPYKVIEVTDKIR